MSLGVSPDEALHEADADPHSRSLSDLRSQGDPYFLPDGTEVELYDLQMARDLNGHTAEVIGFCDTNMRYRVRVNTGPEGGTVKVVSKRNLKLLCQAQRGNSSASSSAPVASSSASSTSSSTSRALPLATGSIVLGPRPASAALNLQFFVTREMVQHALRVLQQRVSSMHARCVAREDGGDDGEEGLELISTQFLRLNEAFDNLQEVGQLYDRAHGRDEDLAAQVAEAIQSCEECMELYTSVRSWRELAVDEVNITRYSIRKHGIVGTLRQELMEVGRDAAQVAGEAQHVVCRGSREGAVLARATSQSLGSSAADAAAAIVNSAGSAVTDTRRQIGDVVEEQITTRLKRIWHLLLTALMLCWVIPMFSLREYYPINSVVANLGIVWSAFWVFFPPRRCVHRGKRMAMLLMWPMLLVVLPISFHYWLLNSGGLRYPARLPLDGLPRWPSWGDDNVRLQQDPRTAATNDVGSEEDAPTEAEKPSGSILAAAAAQDSTSSQAAEHGSQPKQWWARFLHWFQRADRKFGDARVDERPKAFALWQLRRTGGYHGLRSRKVSLRLPGSAAPVTASERQLEI